MSTATIIPIYYIIDLSFLPPALWVPSITNYKYRDLPIKIPVLLTYEQLNALIINDIKTNIIDNFKEYLNVKVIFDHLKYVDVESKLFSGDIKRLKFDIDVTKPFKLSKLIENVI